MHRRAYQLEDTHHTYQTNIKVNTHSGDMPDYQAAENIHNIALSFTHGCKCRYLPTASIVLSFSASPLIPYHAGLCDPCLA